MPTGSDCTSQDFADEQFIASVDSPRAAAVEYVSCRMPDPDIGCSWPDYVIRYTFKEVRVLKNATGADLAYLLASYAPRTLPDQKWFGVYLFPGRSYLVAGSTNIDPNSDRVLIRRACELKDMRGLP